MHMNATLLIPIELQVRELDSKLLLACRAASRGFTAVIGPRREMHFYIPFFNRGIYLSKSITFGSVSVFRMLRDFGHEIVAWDEEALVHLPPESYFKSRVCAEALQYVSHLFAWGEDNVELWRKFSEFPEHVIIHITGNPRGDLLRSDVRSIYQDDADSLRSKYGQFILVNTNFNQVNAFHAQMNLMVPPKNPGEKPSLGRRALAMEMTRSYVEGLCAYKQAIFNDFKKLIPALDKMFPKYSIIVRPHPAEHPGIYHDIAKDCKHVRVTNAGNVIPWLMAASAMIHNGCTTGVEAFALGVPVIAYRASVNEQYDYAFHYLPNLLSQECFNSDELISTLNNVLTGSTKSSNAAKSKALMNRFLAAQAGPLASDRMIDVLEEIVQSRPPDHRLTTIQKLKGIYRVKKRRIKKRLRGLKKEMSHNRRDFLHYRYPDISLENLHERVARIKKVLGINSDFKIKKIYRKFYQISR